MVAAPLESMSESVEPDLRALIAAPRYETRFRLGLLLQSQGFATVAAENASQILGAIARTPIDIAIVSLGLADASGAQLCEAIRRVRPNMPLFVLSDNPAEEEHIAVLEAGADDYLAESVGSRQLALRVRATMRRMGLGGTERLEHGGIVVDLASHRVFANGEEVSLTSTEYRLVLLFLRNPGRVFSRRHLLDNIWNMPSHIVTRTVDTHVKRLRHKLGTTGASIETVRGIGYRCGHAP
jgi:two-component system, OmpR family, phosphate regulon response regulator PhoB